MTLASRAVGPFGAALALGMLVCRAGPIASPPLLESLGSMSLGLQFLFLCYVLSAPSPQPMLFSVMLEGCPVLYVYPVVLLPEMPHSDPGFSQFQLGF